MKKILLIPIIAMTLLTGCDFQKAPKISLKEWLTDIEEDAFSYFTTKDHYKYAKSSYRDYEYKVADIIKNNTSSMKLKKVTPNVSGNHFDYNLDRNIGNYNSIFLMVYENCIIFSAYGKKDNDRLNEYAEYTISEKDSKAIFEGVTARFKEMDDIYNTTNEKADEENTLENFYAELDKNKNDVALYHDEKEVKDTSLSLLDDIKNLSFSEAGSDHTIDYKNRVLYGIDDNYLMEIGKVANKDYYCARLLHYFENPANPFCKVSLNVSVHTYLLTNDKATAFLEKAKAL